MNLNSTVSPAFKAVLQLSPDPGRSLVLETQNLAKPYMLLNCWIGIERGTGQQIYTRNRIFNKQE